MLNVLFSFALTCFFYWAAFDDIKVHWGLRGHDFNVISHGKKKKKLWRTYGLLSFEKQKYDLTPLGVHG